MSKEKPQSNMQRAEALLKKQLAGMGEESKDKDFKIEQKEIDKFTKTLNRIASSKDGRYFLRTLLRDYIGFGKPKRSLDGRVLLQQCGKDAVYTEAIRPYLTKENRKAIENE